MEFLRSDISSSLISNINIVELLGENGITVIGLALTAVQRSSRLFPAVL